MIVEIIEERAEAEFASCFDVSGKIVEVVGVFWNKVVFCDGTLVECILRLDGSDFVREDVAFERFKDIVGVEKPVDMQAIGVREKDQAKLLGFEERRDAPHCVDRIKNGVPGAAEVLGCPRESQSFGSPFNEFFFSHFSCFEFFSPFQESAEAGGAVLEVRGHQRQEPSFEVDVDKDVSDVEECRSGGIHSEGGEGLFGSGRSSSPSTNSAAICEALGRACLARCSF